MATFFEGEKWLGKKKIKIGKNAAQRCLVQGNWAQLFTTKNIQTNYSIWMISGARLRDGFDILLITEH